uniref:PDZ domain-containing protein n=1 Tax=Junco hyemalis TaxID=40217 RepID=A0A8C5IPQ2_JUNHY
MCWSMQCTGPQYPALWDTGVLPTPRGSRVSAGGVHGPALSHCPPSRSPLSPQRLWSPPGTHHSAATPSMERAGLGLAGDRSPGRDTLRPGTLPSLSDLGEPLEAVRREEKKGADAAEGRHRVHPQGGGQELAGGGAPRPRGHLPLQLRGDPAAHRGAQAHQGSHAPGAGIRRGAGALQLPRGCARGALLSQGRADLPGAPGERELVRGAHLGHQPPGHLPRHLRAGAEGAAGQSHGRGHPRLPRPRQPPIPGPAALARPPQPAGSRGVPPGSQAGSRRRCHLPPVPKAAPRWHPQPLGGLCQPPTPCGAAASWLEPRAAPDPGGGTEQRPARARPVLQRLRDPVDSVPGPVPVPAPKRRRAGAAGRGQGGCHAAMRRRLVRGSVQEDAEIRHFPRELRGAGVTRGRGDRGGFLVSRSVPAVSPHGDEAPPAPSRPYGAASNRDGSPSAGCLPRPGALTRPLPTAAGATGPGSPRALPGAGPDHDGRAPPCGSVSGSRLRFFSVIKAPLSATLRVPGLGRSRSGTRPTGAVGGGAAWGRGDPPTPTGGPGAGPAPPCAPSGKGGSCARSPARLLPRRRRRPGAALGSAAPRGRPARPPRAAAAMPVTATATVTLPGPAPWGFRICGGRDFGKPIAVSKVTEHGKAAAGDLRPGDVIVAINGESTAEMLNVEAQNKIKRSAGQLRLEVQRCPVPSPSVTNGDTSLEGLATRFQDTLQVPSESQRALRSLDPSLASLSASSQPLEQEFTCPGLSQERPPSRQSSSQGPVLPPPPRPPSPEPGAPQSPWAAPRERRLSSPSSSACLRYGAGWGLWGPSPVSPRGFVTRGCSGSPGKGLTHLQAGGAEGGPGRPGQLPGWREQVAGGLWGGSRNSGAGNPPKISRPPAKSRSRP